MIELFFLNREISDLKIENKKKMNYISSFFKKTQTSSTQTDSEESFQSQKQIEHNKLYKHEKVFPTTTPSPFLSQKQKSQMDAYKQ